jgi:hypothetical protein
MRKDVVDDVIALHVVRLDSKRRSPPVNLGIIDHV